MFSGMGTMFEGATQAAEAYDRWATEQGWDMSKLANGDKTQGREKGSFETLSQQTGEFLLGQFTAIRVHAGNIHDLISNMFIDYAAIAGYLKAIADNTLNTVAELKQLRADFKRARDEGFKII
jgi:hypothetical protein